MADSTSLFRVRVRLPDESLTLDLPPDSTLKDLLSRLSKHAKMVLSSSQLLDSKKRPIIAEQTRTLVSLGYTSGAGFIVCVLYVTLVTGLNG